jgi:membrane associated rhomboid family serine protease
MTDTAVPIPFGLVPLPGVRTRLPIGTIVVLVCWMVCTTLYHLGITGLFLAVRRDPHALAAGQWWRLVSPVLVQPDPWPTVIGLAVAAVVVGVAAERVFGTARWTVLLLAGALAGHGIGELWQPYSSGVSVAFCGPLGALATYALLTNGRRHLPRLVGLALVLVGGVVLTTVTDIHGPAILAGAVVSAVAFRPPRGHGAAH